MLGPRRSRSSRRRRSSRAQAEHQSQPAAPAASVASARDLPFADPFTWTPVPLRNYLRPIHRVHWACQTPSATLRDVSATRPSRREADRRAPQQATRRDGRTAAAWVIAPARVRTDPAAITLTSTATHGRPSGAGSRISRGWASRVVEELELAGYVSGSDSRHAGRQIRLRSSLGDVERCLPGQAEAIDAPSRRSTTPSAP